MTETQKRKIAESIVAEWEHDHQDGTEPEVTFELRGQKVKVVFTGGVEYQAEDIEGGNSQGYVCHGGEVAYAGVSFDWTSLFFPIERFAANGELHEDFAPFILAAELVIETQGNEVEE